jgi:haloacid dehalogenase superfamily, subfamily IA, variant 1 with third motif having Dx(3-4)D or Dx(3-4)E
MKKVYLFDWGDTIMKDFPDEQGAMYTWKKIMIMPFADKMLQVLSKSADCYLATNAKDSSKEDIIKALARVNLHEYFKDIFCFRELGVVKPAKEYFDLVLKKLGEKKENLVMIGDNLESDIYGVQNIGIDTILYDPENKNPNYKGRKISNLMMILDDIE